MLCSEKGGRWLRTDAGGYSEKGGRWLRTDAGVCSEKEPALLFLCTDELRFENGFIAFLTHLTKTP